MKYTYICLSVALAAWFVHVDARNAEWATHFEDATVADEFQLGRRLSASKKSSYYAVDSDEDKGARFVTSLRSPGNNRSAVVGAGRVAYGDQATSSQFPTVVYLSVGDYMCTGTIIAPRAVLTAAHCVRTQGGGWVKRSEVKVYYGTNVLRKSKSVGINLLITPKYNARTNYGDLALIRLATPIVLPGVPYTTLADASTTLPAKVAVVGWGEMETGSNPDVLMYTMLSTMTTARCNYVHKAILGDLPPAGAMCFGLDVNPYTASCPGDSGGPYFITTTQPIIQVAIVSYGPDIECGSTSNNLDVGTNVAYWRKWIDAQLVRFLMT